MGGDDDVDIWQWWSPPRPRADDAPVSPVDDDAFEESRPELAAPVEADAEADPDIAEFVREMNGKLDALAERIDILERRRAEFTARHDLRRQ